MFRCYTVEGFRHKQECDPKTKLVDHKNRIINKDFYECDYPDHTVLREVVHFAYGYLDSTGFIDHINIWRRHSGNPAELVMVMHNDEATRAKAIEFDMRYNMPLKKYTNRVV